MASLTPRASGFWANADDSDDEELRDQGNTNMGTSRSKPRRNGLEDDDDEEGYFAGQGEDLEQQERLLGEEDSMYDGRTPLDKTIDRIGMGSYQWTLLSLCGLGWMADNMWIQAIAIILPRVQQHYSVPDSYIGLVSSSMFGGMMIGAIGWGTCSDLMGRITAFNATLFFTAVFGILASFANSFWSLCVILFLLGSSVGGSMPTDGTLLLEHMPKKKQYLVTALSVFFSVGAVLSAVVALLVVPQHSCPRNSEPNAPVCDPDTQNKGWKYLLTALGLITLTMFIARILFFRLHESPRYLVHAGRPQDAVKSLQLISRFNGSDLELELEDVRDHHLPHETAPTQTLSPTEMEGASAAGGATMGLEVGGGGEMGGRPRATSRTVLFDASAISVPGDDAGGSNGGGILKHASSGSDSSSSGKGYATMGETPALVPQDSQAPAGESAPTPSSSYPPPPTPTQPTSSTAFINSRPVDLQHQRSLSSPPAFSHRPRSQSYRRHKRRSSTLASQRRLSASEYEKRLCWSLPRWLRRPLWAWLDRVCMVLSPEWVRTTVLVWVVWCMMSLAYTMFNVFLPKLLETSNASMGASGKAVSVSEVPSTGPSKTLEESLWDVVIFTVGGCPGAILGAWLIESSLGRRWSLAGSTFLTAFFCVVFAMVKNEWAVRASTVGISLSATAMWAVLYGWTPEIFGTKVRGTACGIASALSRIGGMIAPILGGMLLMMDRSVPVYASVVIFALAGVCVLLLREGEDNGAAGKERVIVH